MYGCFSFCLLICRSNILFNRTNIFRDKTSFCPFLTWLLPGLKNQSILVIFFRPGRSHVRNWRKLVLSLKILVLLKRIFDLPLQFSFSYMPILIIIMLAPNYTCFLQAFCLSLTRIAIFLAT